MFLWYGNEICCRYMIRVYHNKVLVFLYPWGYRNRILRCYMLQCLQGGETNMALLYAYMHGPVKPPNMARRFIAGANYGSISYTKLETLFWGYCTIFNMVRHENIMFLRLVPVFEGDRTTFIRSTSVCFIFSKRSVFHLLLPLPPMAQSYILKPMDVLDPWAGGP